MSSFGRRLKSLRAKTGKSQTDVSIEIGFKQTRISFLERQEKAPKEDVVRKFAEYYSVPITYFYGHELNDPDQDTINYIDSLKNEEMDLSSDYEVIMHSLSELEEDKIKLVKQIVESYVAKKKEHEG